MSSTTVTLGAFVFNPSAIRVGAKPRTINVATNALAANPIQSTAFTSGFRPITIGGFLKGVDTQGETAEEHLVRLVHNLRTEVAKNTNTLTISWANVTAPETYTVYKNEDVDLDYEAHADLTHMVEYTVTLNCLP